jgi:hypothetical protein
MRSTFNQGGSNLYVDAVELAFLYADNNNVFVATSAGNSGPGGNGLVVFVSSASWKKVNYFINVEMQSFMINLP